MQAELYRLQNPHTHISPPPVLCEFTVEIREEDRSYVDRLRSALSAAVKIGMTADFENEELPVEGIPEWLLSIGTSSSENAPKFSTAGREAYVNHTARNPWTLQDWLYQFDPEDDSRGWEVWDVTASGKSTVSIWVDSWGEPFFGHLDLLWVAYTAGGLQVTGPTVQSSEEWASRSD